VKPHALVGLLVAFEGVMELAAALPAPFRLGVWFFIDGLITHCSGDCWLPSGPSAASGPRHAFGVAPLGGPGGGPSFRAVNC